MHVGGGELSATGWGGPLQSASMTRQASGVVAQLKEGLEEIGTSLINLRKETPSYQAKL